MGSKCPECGTDLTQYSDIAVHGGSIGSMGGSTLYIDGTFPCPECDARLNYEAKLTSDSPK